MDTKTCSVCNVEKPITEFYRKGKTKAGKTVYAAKCKPCMTEYAKRYTASATVARRESRAVDRESYNAYMREYRARNPERMHAYDANRDKELRNAARATRHARRKDDVAYRAMRRVAKERRRAKINGVDSDFTSQDWQRVLADFNHCCAYCGSCDNLTQDHFVPLKKGGSHTPSNIVPACKSCNCSKHDDLPQDWMPAETYRKLVSYLQCSAPRGPIH
jgi:5-methylcytosine-specific restriction endonuclease McrA